MIPNDPTGDDGRPGHGHRAPGQAGARALPPPPPPRSLASQLLEDPNDEAPELLRRRNDVPNPSTGRVKTSGRESFCVTFQPPTKAPQESRKVALSCL